MSVPELKRVHVIRHAMGNARDSRRPARYCG